MAASSNGTDRLGSDVDAANERPHKKQRKQRQCYSCEGEQVPVCMSEFRGLTSDH